MFYYLDLFFNYVCKIIQNTIFSKAEKKENELSLEQF